MTKSGIAVLIIVLGSLPITLAQPFVGVLVWNWLAYFNPQTVMTWGALDDYRLALYVGAATVAGMFLSGKDRFRTIGGQQVGLVFLFGATLVVSTLAALNRRPAVDKLIEFGKMFLMCYVMLCLVRTEKRFRILVFTTALFVCAVGMKSALVAPLHPLARIYGPMASKMADNNDYALAMNMMLPFFWALAATERDWRLRWAWRVCLALTVVAVLFTYSRGGFIGLGITVVFLAWRSQRKVLAAAVLGVGLLVGSMYLATDVGGRLEERLGTLRQPTQEGSAQDRFRAWQTALNMAQARPFTGVGLRNFFSQYRQYWPEGVPPGADYAKVAHSAYFQVLGEAGYVSLLFFVALIVSTLVLLERLNWRLKHTPPDVAILDPDDPDAPPAPAPADHVARLRRYVLMCQISVIAYAVTAAFLSRHDFDLYFQIVFMAVMLRQMAQGLVARSPEEPLAVEAEAASPALVRAEA
jgi:putative inorganic carbon (HCO3(-)) transporter